MLAQFPTAVLVDTTRPLSVTPEVSALLSAGCIVAVGVSGGKDSQAMAIALRDYLDSVGHSGPRILTHADLGSIEWRTSLQACEHLARHLGWELLVVRRSAGDLLHRWQDRWRRNLARYKALSCVHLIQPFSSASKRFCTSELKSGPISSALKKRFPGQAIVSAVGIRRDESVARAKKPVSATDKRLSTKAIQGLTWNPIIEWSISDVLSRIAHAGLPLHEAYTVYGSTRLSCAYCVLASMRDLQAASRCPENAAVFRLLVDLEIDSCFSFQSNRWLADVAPHLLSDQQREGIAHAKHVAEQRRRIEAEIPKHLQFVKGWPTAVPNDAECELIASVRLRVAALHGMAVGCTSGSEVRDRYAQLMQIAADKAAAKSARAIKRKKNKKSK